MSKLSISRCRTTLATLALAAAAFTTGCVTEVDDTTPSAIADRDDRSALAAADRHRAGTDRELAGDEREAIAVDPDRESVAEDDLADAAEELAADIATGQLTDRELVLVTVIASLEEERSFAWADPVLQAARPSPQPLPDIDAEEADFVDPGAPLQQGGH